MTPPPRRRNVAVTIPVLLNDSDPDGDALTIISVSPTNGIASISGTNVVFTPTNNFARHGRIIGYTIRDNFGGTNSALDHGLRDEPSAGRRE